MLYGVNAVSATSYEEISEDEMFIQDVYYKNATETYFILVFPPGGTATDFSLFSEEEDFAIKANITSALVSIEVEENTQVTLELYNATDDMIFTKNYSVYDVNYVAGISESTPQDLTILDYKIAWEIPLYILTAGFVISLAYYGYELYVDKRVVMCQRR